MMRPDGPRLKVCPKTVIGATPDVIVVPSTTATLAPLGSKIVKGCPPAVNTAWLAPPFARDDPACPVSLVMAEFPLFWLETNGTVCVFTLAVSVKVPAWAEVGEDVVEKLAENGDERLTVPDDCSDKADEEDPPPLLRAALPYRTL